MEEGEAPTKKTPANHLNQASADKENQRNWASIATGDCTFALVGLVCFKSRDELHACLPLVFHVYYFLILGDLTCNEFDMIG